MFEPMRTTLFIMIAVVCAVNATQAETLRNSSRPIEQRIPTRETFYSTKAPERASPVQGDDVSPDPVDRLEDKIMNREEHICDGC